jgi:hypothetical protein
MLHPHHAVIQLTNRSSPFANVKGGSKRIMTQTALFSMDFTNIRSNIAVSIDSAARTIAKPDILNSSNLHPKHRDIPPPIGANSVRAKIRHIKTDTAFFMFFPYSFPSIFAN